MNMNSFNIIYEKCIPVSNSNDLIYIPVKDIFNTNNNLYLTGNFWEKAPIIKLLVAIASSTLRPQTNDEIRYYIKNPDLFCEKISIYLNRWKKRFDIFDPEYPFLQTNFFKKNYPDWTSEEKGFKRTPTLKAIVEEGKTTTNLKYINEPLLNGKTIFLTILHSLVQGGTLKNALPKQGPELIPKGKVTRVNSTYPPSLSTNGTYGTLNYFIEDPTNLINTIILNMIAEKDIKPIWKRGFGKPIWEYDIGNNYNKFLEIKNEITQTFLGRLIPWSKFIWIDPKKPDQMLYSHAEGISLTQILEILKENGKYENFYNIPDTNPKKKSCLKHIKKNQDLWKDIASFNIRENTPIILRKLERENIGIDYIKIISTAKDIRGTSGLVFEKSLYESELIISTYSLQKLLSDYLLPNNFNPGLALKDAEKAYDQLIRALYILNKELNFIKNDGSKNSYAKGFTEKSTAYFWSNLKIVFPEFLNKEENDQDLNKFWKKKLIEYIKESLYLLKDKSPKKIKAITKAINSITLGDKND